MPHNLIECEIFVLARWPFIIRSGQFLSFKNIAAIKFHVLHFLAGQIASIFFVIVKLFDRTSKGLINPIL